MTEARTLPATSPLSGESSDWIAIRELTARYNRAADDGDVDGFVSVFVEDGVLEVRAGGDTQRYEGRAELARVPARSGAQQVHVTTDPIVEISGGTATQLCTLVLCRRTGGVLTGLTTGRYSDELVRTSEGWRFARRTVAVDAGEGKFQAREGETT